MADLRKFFAALVGIVEAEPTQQDFVIVHSLSSIEEPTLSPLAAVLAPPIVDPTHGRAPRRTGNPRLRIRTVSGIRLAAGLPAADPRNLTGRRAGLYVAEWEVWLLDDNGQEHALGFHATGADALADLPVVLREVGLLNEDGTRPSEDEERESRAA
ncbi:hypothetical protein [Kocuria sp. KH4]